MTQQHRYGEQGTDIAAKYILEPNNLRGENIFDSYVY